MLQKLVAQVAVKMLERTAADTLQMKMVLTIAHSHVLIYK
jgi:hypothetical protein